MAKRRGLLRLLDQRERLQDDALEAFDAEMSGLAENIGRRLANILGEDPDAIFPADGDDGFDIGTTDFETRLAGLTDTDQLRATVLISSLAEVEEFVEACGLDKARASMREAVANISGVAEQTFEVQGISDANGALDTVAAEALVGGFFETAFEEGLFGKGRRDTADRIKRALSSSLGMVPLKELVENIAQGEIDKIPRAITEARTSLAEADRVAHETVRRTLDPDGKEFLQAYFGPKDDDLVRPFCRHLVGKAFRVDDFAKANNAQTPSHPTISGGGWNCRHYVTAVPNTKSALKALGVVRGTPQDIEKANRAAAAKRGKRKAR